MCMLVCRRRLFGNPGLEAIKAANKPEAGNWLYFVTINLTTGETLFAATSAEHQVNVAKLTAFCKHEPRSVPLDHQDPDL